METRMTRAAKLVENQSNKPGLRRSRHSCLTKLAAHLPVFFFISCYTELAVFISDLYIVSDQFFFLFFFLDLDYIYIYIFFKLIYWGDNCQ